MKKILERSKLLLWIMIGVIVIMASCKKDPVIATGLTLNNANLNVQVGATSTLTPFLVPIDATNQTIKWRSASQAIATVADGVVTGVSLGSTTITAVSQSDTTIKATCAVLVTPSTGQVITVSGDITADTKWYSVAKYMLSGFVYVKNN